MLRLAHSRRLGQVQLARPHFLEAIPLDFSTPNQWKPETDEQPTEVHVKICPKKRPSSKEKVKLQSHSCHPWRLTENSMMSQLTHGVTVTVH